MQFRSKLVATCFLLLSALHSVGAQGATVWDEAINGDLSGDYANPSHVMLSTGVNSLLASVGTNTEGMQDLDYLRIDVPRGRKLTKILLQAYVSNDPLAFVGMQAGPAFTFPADDAFSHFNDLLGWTHFGPGEGDQPGNDLLPRMGMNAGTPFTPPLPSGSYTLWMQQLGVLTTFQFDLIVSPLMKGDFNLDGVRNASDIQAMLTALTDLESFKSTNNLSQADLLAVGDVDGVNGVTNADIQAELDLIAGAGTGSIVTVPEPSSMALGTLGLMIVALQSAARLSLRAH